MPESLDHVLLAVRHIKRDDLLHLATEAHGYLNTGFQNFGSRDLDDFSQQDSESAASSSWHDIPADKLATSTYLEGADWHLRKAKQEQGEVLKADHLRMAAVLIRFSRELDGLREIEEREIGDEQEESTSLPSGSTMCWDLRELHQKADDWLYDRQEGDSRFHQLKVLSFHATVRNLRLGGSAEEAFGLADKPDDFFRGHGADLLRADFDTELAFGGVLSGQCDAAIDQLKKHESFWTEDHRAKDWKMAQGRFEQAVAVVHLAAGSLAEASRRLTLAVKCFEAFNTLSVYLNTQCQVAQLSARLTLIELRAAGLVSDDPVEGRDGLNEATLLAASQREILAQCEAMLNDVERIRQRWMVVFRARDPLSMVLRIVLADLAAVLAELDSEHAARLGLRLSIMVKQSGFAQLVRSQQALLSGAVQGWVQYVFRTEREGPGNSLDALRERMPSVLADLVMPAQVGVDSILQEVVGKVLLDFVCLPRLIVRPRRNDTGTGSWEYTSEYLWFRSNRLGAVGCVAKSVSTRYMWFEELKLGKGYDALFRNGLGEKGFLDAFHETADTLDNRILWYTAAIELLPERLRMLLDEAPANSPIEILISPHQELSLLPWYALALDSKGNSRLIDRAMVSHVPLLASYRCDPDYVVQGPALVRIVDDPEVNTQDEQDAWGLPHGGQSLFACTLPPRKAQPELLVKKLAQQLKNKNSWGMVYVASHGEGERDKSGFHQYLTLPEGNLTAGQALSLFWPTDVMFNACFVGGIEDKEDSEPMGFVIAAMVGGARTVVGGLQGVGIEGASRIGAAVIQRLGTKTPLHRLLYEEQRKLAHTTLHLCDWASLAAFIV